MSKESAISPWVRPALIGWAAFMGFGIALLAGMIDLFVPGAGMRFGNTINQVLTGVPDWIGDVLQTFFGFYAIGKSGEKMVSHYRKPDLAEAAREVDSDGV